MSDGIYVALSGALAQQRALETVAHNVANVNTTGFRADRLLFRAELARVGGEESDGPAPDTLRFASVQTARISSKGGPIEETGEPLHVAIEGDAWFSVRGAQGLRLTRAGAFVLDGQGVLRTPDGLAVLSRPERPGAPPRPLRVPPGSGTARFDEHGRLLVDERPVGRLWLQRADFASLRREGLTRVVPGGGLRDVSEQVRVRPGALERSNVNPVAGMIELVEVTRSFEAMQKLVDTYRQLDERTARDLAG